VTDNSANFRSSLWSR